MGQDWAGHNVKLYIPKMPYLVNMPQNGFVNIAVQEKDKKELTRRKIRREGKLQEEISWGEFLLEATNHLK